MMPKQIGKPTRDIIEALEKKEKAESEENGRLFNRRSNIEFSNRFKSCYPPKAVFNESKLDCVRRLIKNKLKKDFLKQQLKTQTSITYLCWLFYIKCFTLYRKLFVKT